MTMYLERRILNVLESVQRRYRSPYADTKVLSKSTRSMQPPRGSSMRTSKRCEMLVRFLKLRSTCSYLIGTLMLAYDTA